MRLFRMIISIFYDADWCGLIGFFVGIRIDEAMGGAILFSLIAGIACVIYDRESGKMKRAKQQPLECAFRGLLLFYFTYSYFLI